MPREAEARPAICPRCSPGRRRDGLRRDYLRDVGAPAPAIWASAKLPRIKAWKLIIALSQKAVFCVILRPNGAQSAPRAEKNSQKMGLLQIVSRARGDRAHPPRGYDLGGVARALRRGVCRASSLLASRAPAASGLRLVAGRACAAAAEFVGDHRALRRARLGSSGFGPLRRAAAAYSSPSGRTLMRDSHPA